MTISNSSGRLAAAAIAFSLFAAAPGAFAKGDVEAGKAKSVTCATCHGADGNSPNPLWPRLAGQWPDYIVKALEDYASGQRNNAVMAGFAATLTPEDREDLAAYFSSQEATIYTIEPD